MYKNSMFIILTHTQKLSPQTGQMAHCSQTSFPLLFSVNLNTLKQIITEHGVGYHLSRYCGHYHTTFIFIFLSNKRESPHVLGSCSDCICAVTEAGV